MQKKIIASLLVSPLAFNAMANITMDPVNNAAWTATGITGTDIFKDGVVTCPIGAGVISQPYTIKAPGKYNITFANSQNAVFKVFSGGKEIASGEGSVEFEMTSAGEIELRVSAKDPASAFSFGNVEVVVEFNFDEKKTTLLNAANSAYKYIGIPEDNKSEVANDLRKRSVELQNTLNALRKEINALPGEDGEDADKLKAYEDNKLYEDPNAIEVKIEELKKNSDALNEEIVAENNRYTTVTNNTAARDALLGEVAALEASLKTVTDNINAEGVSEAVKGECSADAKAAADAIAAYKDFIESEYADLEKTDIKVESQNAAIEKMIADLDAKFNKAVADEKALAELADMKKSLDDAYLQAQIAITGFAGVEGHENVFGAKQADWMNQIASEKKTGTTALNDKDPANAEANKAIVQQAIENINAIVKAARTLVDDQNAAMTAAQAALDQVKTDFKDQTDAFEADSEGLTIAADVIKTYNDKVKAINDAIAEAKGTVDTEYGKNDLTADDYTAKLTAIDALVTDLNKFLGDQNLVNKAEAQRALNELRKHITEAQGGLEVNILAKFEGNGDGTLPSIQDAINALKGDNTEVMKAIEAAQKNADTLIEAFTSAKSAYDEFNAAITRLNCIVPGKTIIPGSKYDKVNGIDKTVTEFNEHDTKWENAYTAAAAKNSQECYKAATDLAEEIKAYDWKSMIDDAFNDFEDQATDANYQVAVTKLAAVKKNADAAFPAEAYTEVDNAMTEIQTLLDAAVANKVAFSDKDKVDAKVKACADIDAKVEDVLGSIKTLSDNQAAYTGFVADLNNVQNELNALSKYNEDYALNPAQDFFAGKIGTEEKPDAETLWAEYKTINSQLDEALAARSVVDDKETIKANINGLLTKISNMQANIRANEDAHNAQLAKSQEARDKITSCLSDIQKNTATALVAEWVAKLESLRDNDLLNTDRAVTQAYAKGECAKSDALNVYDRIIKEASDIKVQFTNGYAAEVAKNNKQIVLDAGWEGTVENLRASYLNAISAYNAYRGIKNTGYKAYLTENNVFESHADIYDYSTKIRVLESNVSTAVDDATAQEKALTPADFSNFATEKAKVLMEEMKQKVAEMEQGFNEAGIDYYAILNGKAEGAIDEAKTKLADAGLADQAADILHDAKENLKKGQEAYTNAMAPEGENGKNFGLKMDVIAGYLDQVMPIDLQTGAMKKWNSEYNAALNTFNDLSAELAGYTSASPEVKATQTALFNTAKGNAASLNNTVLADESLIDNLAADITALNGYLNAAKAAVAKVKADNDANKLEQDALTNYNNVVIPGLESQINALKAFINALGGTSTDAVEEAEAAAEAAVKAVADGVATNEGQLIDKKSDIDTLIDNAETVINRAYSAAFAAEVDYLNNVLLKQAKESFNNAKAADTDGANKTLLDEINVSLDNIIIAVGKLPLDPSEEYTSASFKKDALGYETQICKFIAELQNMYKPYEGETTVDGVLGELGQAVGAVQESIDNAKTTLSGYEKEVQDEFGPQVETLQSELDNIESEFQAAGSTVIAQQENYEKRISEVGDKLAELENAAANKQVVAKQHAESNARYDVLKGEYDKLVGRLDAFKQMLQEYGVDGEKYIYDIQYYLTLSIDDLEAQKKAFSLSASSKLKGGERADYLLKLYTLDAKKTHAKNLQEIADSKLMSVGSALEGNIVPDVKAEITSALVSCRNQYNTLNSDIQGFIPSDNVDKPGADNIDTYIQMSETIAEEADKLIAKAEENRFYPGDLNGSEDGKVNVADIQILLTWIGEGMTYDALYAENEALACAADMTGDKMLNIADVTILIQKVLNPEAGAGTYAMVRGVMPSESSIDAVLVGEDNGTRTYAINLANNENFIAGQFDLTVDAGAEIVSVTAADRLGSHELYTFDNTDNTRVIVASMENAEISGNEGATIYVEVKGRSGVGISNAIFADENSQAYSLGDKTPGTSGIDSILDSAKAVKEAIYDAAGRALKSVQRGINIIRHSDGTVTKEIRK